jgi:hypothetical protein
MSENTTENSERAAPVGVKATPLPFDAGYVYAYLKAALLSVEPEGVTDPHAAYFLDWFEQIGTDHNRFPRLGCTKPEKDGAPGLGCVPAAGNLRGAIEEALASIEAGMVWGAADTLREALVAPPARSRSAKAK